MNKLCLFNGQLLSLSEVQLSKVMGGLLYGESVYEQLRVHQGKILFLEEHYFHLMAGMRRMRMPIPSYFTPDAFERELTRYVSNLQQDNVSLRFQVEMTAKKVNYWITSVHLQAPLLYEVKNSKLEMYRESYVAADEYNSINILDPLQRIYRIFAQENEYDDLVLMNPSKRVARFIEGSLFVLTEEDEILTPKITEGAKNSVWRKQMIQLLGKRPEFSSVKETEIKPFSLQKSQALFVVTEGQCIKLYANFRKKAYDTSYLYTIIDDQLKALRT